MTTTGYIPTLSHRFLLSLVVVVVMSSQACTGVGQSSLPASQSVAKSALDKEAQQTAEAFLKRAYYKCGDSYFKQITQSAPASWNVKVDPDPVYYQVKGFAWEVKGSEVIYPPLTEAERLNGVNRPVVWKGEIYITGTVFREHKHRYGGGGPKEWTAWQDIRRSDPRYPNAFHLSYDHFPIEKRSGKWIVLNDQGGPIEGAGITPVDCNAIP